MGFQRGKRSKKVHLDDFVYVYDLYRHNVCHNVEKCGARLGVSGKTFQSWLRELYAKDFYGNRCSFIIENEENDERFKEW